jgi:ATP-binding cassette, subfamily C, type I secretion system permease/ATPase
MRPVNRSPSQQRSELATALSACRDAIIATALMSGMSNILMLTGAIFMLEIYDRVLPSRSVPTLVGLIILAGGLFTAQALIDMIRGRILVRIGGSLDETLSGRVYETIVQLPLKIGGRTDGMQPMRDLDTVRSFLSGLGPIALFDLSWLPIYLAVCFAFHPLIGLAALIGAIILGALTYMTEVMTREPTRAATGFATRRNILAETSRRNAEAVTAMGMTGRIAALWGDANQKYMLSQRRASDVAGGFSSVSKALRMMLQSSVLAVGAWLVIHQEATAGIIIAGSILSARALAPVDLAIGNWKGFVAARQSWQRLTKLLGIMPAQAAVMALQPPRKSATVEGIAGIPPGSNRVVVQDINLSLQSGNALGIIGPSGSGKSSLACMLVGV